MVLGNKNHLRCSFAFPLSGLVTVCCDITRLQEAKAQSVQRLCSCHKHMDDCFFSSSVEDNVITAESVRAAECFILVYKTLYQV